MHFDGHGVYADLEKSILADWAALLSSVVLKADSKGKHGFLLFEHPDGEDRIRPVSGEQPGKLLHDNGVSVLVLNACQSAMHEATTGSTRGSDPAADRPKVSLQRTFMTKSVRSARCRRRVSRPYWGGCDTACSWSRWLSTAAFWNPAVKAPAAESSFGSIRLNSHRAHSIQCVACVQVRAGSFDGESANAQDHREPVGEGHLSDRMLPDRVAR